MTIIGILSDTHTVLRPEAFSALSGSNLIIHAGDVGDPDVIEDLSRIATVYAVRGNMDNGSWSEGLPVTDVVDVDGHLIYVVHDLNDLDLVPFAAGIEMVVFGHSHEPEIVEKDSVIYLNPGSAGPRRHSLPVSVAVVTVRPEGLFPRIIKLNV